MYKRINDRCNTRQAFTLIELLIVVAIIAILAAIAVPNFLEAQVRAKVSRVRADVRSVATGMETYKIDTNKYPPMADYPYASFTAPTGTATTAQFSSRIPSWLSTPVSYLTSLPYDVFIPGLHKPPQDHWNRYVYFNYDEWASHSGTALQAGRRTVTGGYLYYSYGPDKDTNQAAPKLGVNATWTRYDATNGTVSWGNIIRTAKSPEGQISSHPDVTGATAGPN